MTMALLAIAPIILVLLAVSGLFSAAETAMTGASRGRMHQLEREGDHAAARVRAVLGRIGAQSGALLLALSEPAVIHGRRVDWRGEVERVTGEANRAVHAALVRAAMRDLRAAYGAVDAG